MRLFPGQKLEVTRTFTQEDFDRFAALTGDDNPIHVDPAFASRTRFGRTLCHGMLLFSTLDGAIRRGLREHDPEIEGIELMFPGPTYVGDAMRISVEITAWSEETRRAQISLSVVAPDGQPGCVAQARVFMRRAA